VPAPFQFPFRIRRAHNPKWTNRQSEFDGASPGMDDTDHALFPRFSAELVATAPKDTPVVMLQSASVWQDHIGSRFALARHLANGASVGPDRAEDEAVSSTSAIAPTPTGRRIRRLHWNYGQENLRGMLCVQVDCVVGNLRAAVVVERFSRVWVDIEAGKVAT
jgi:hypothetical protein